MFSALEVNFFNNETTVDKILNAYKKKDTSLIEEYRAYYSIKLPKATGIK